MRSIIHFTITILIFVASISAQELKLPTNPLDGRIAFEEKGCIVCHSLSGYGGTLGPDLTRQKYYGSFLELASIIWNHIPEMNRKFRELKFERPYFSENEMLDLMYFIYYLKYLGEPGSVSNGKKLLNSKGCMKCHQVTGGSVVAPDFAELQQFSSPLYMAQAMWNHGPSMQEKMNNLDMSYPEMTGENIADLTAYIKHSALEVAEIRMSPGNPSKGKFVFKKKGCISCHQVENSKGNSGPDLTELKLNKSVTEIAAQMWNHSPTMIEYMKEGSIGYPQFEANEMADLIAYLYFLGFEDQEGNVDEGELVYADKGCADCHESGNENTGPDLSKKKYSNSRIKILQKMWNHASRMEDLLLIQNNKWPVLTTKEMQDLFTYLRSISKNQ
ncbi:c-type cytochrome [Bacteroidota bacterium]